MISPRLTDVVTWAQQTTLLLTRYGYIPKLTDPDRWKEWANYVVSIPAIAASGAPQPAFFADWRDWARRFNESLLGIGDV